MAKNKILYQDDWFLIIDAKFKHNFYFIKQRVNNEYIAGDAFFYDTRKYLSSSCAIHKAYLPGLDNKNVFGKIITATYEPKYYIVYKIKKQFVDVLNNVLFNLNKVNDLYDKRAKGLKLSYAFYVSYLNYTNSKFLPYYSLLNNIILVSSNGHYYITKK